jgi:hypothetical protein
MTKDFVRGYNAGWLDAITAVRRALATPNKPDGWLDHELTQWEREHPSPQETAE